MRGVRPNRGGVRLAEIPASPADAIAEQVSLAGSTRVAVPMMSPANVAQALSSHRVRRALGLRIVFTVPQVTSMNNVQGAFFGVATLAALIEACFDRQRRWLYYSAAVVLFVLAIASNESTALLFPVYGLALLSFWNTSPADGRAHARATISIAEKFRVWRQHIARRWLDGIGSFIQRFAHASLLSLPFAAVGLSALVSFWACRCNEASSSFFGWDNARYLWQIYIGRIAWPIGALEAPNRVSEPHQIAAIAVAVLVVIVALWGPPLARIGGAFLILATLPYIAVWALTAQRYTYQATAGFALLVPAVLAAVWDFAGPG